MAKDPEYYEEKYGHLRANVPRRRKMYGWIIFLAIATFVASIVDIGMLDEILFWGVMAAYAILIIWAILMLFSRKDSFDEIVDEDYEPGEQDRTHLRCPTCRHVFAFDMEHLNERADDVNFNCPECGTIHRVPPVQRAPVQAVVPGGGSYGPSFRCTNCREHWSVGALGHDPKADVRFSACPHCGVPDSVRAVYD